MVSKPLVRPYLFVGLLLDSPLKVSIVNHENNDDFGKQKPFALMAFGPAGIPKVSNSKLGPH